MTMEKGPATYLSVGAELDRRKEEMQRMGLEIKMALLHYKSGVIKLPQSFHLIKAFPEFGTYQGLLLREGGIVSRVYVNDEVVDKRKEDMIVLLDDGIYRIPWKDTNGFPKIVPDYESKKEIEPEEYLTYGYNAMDAIRIVFLATNRLKACL